MRLDFNILWVEDQPTNVQSQRTAIERMIRTEGFRLQVAPASSVAEARQFLSSEIYGDHIDLILMDYNLGAGPSGEEGIRDVRATFPYKDLVFYSANAADLSGLVADNQFDGVFCSTREELPHAVFGLFQTLIKKVLDIDHARGIVLGATSDIDGLIVDCLAALCSKSGEGLSDQALKIIALRLGEIRKRFEKTAKAVEAATKVEDLQAHHAVYTSIDRLNLLRKLLAPSSNHAAACERMKAYTRTVPVRNDLAHVRVQRDGFSRKLFNRDGKELTRGELRAMLLDLLGHQETLEKLLADLTT